MRRSKETAQQVKLLQQQLATAKIFARLTHVAYFLVVKPGASVVKGEISARIFMPGEVRLRA